MRTTYQQYGSLFLWILRLVGSWPYLVSWTRRCKVVALLTSTRPRPLHTPPRTPNAVFVGSLLWLSDPLHHHNDDDHHRPTAAAAAAVAGGGGGDALRAATGIRPSLHPVTINAIARALQVRARGLHDHPDLPLRFSPIHTALDVAVAAGRIAAEAIVLRQASSARDGMELTVPEQETVAGRVVGVMVRLTDLERQLLTKCQNVGWISKYNEWDSFGILPEETDPTAVDERIKGDPLFSMNRAECLLALFLAHVEEPELRRKNATVPGGSRVDFIDEDRKEVLLR